MNKMIDLSGVVLHTPRMTLRPWRETDLQDFYDYASVDGVGQMAGWKPHESIEESRQILTSFIMGRKTFALEYRGRCIGSIGVERYKQKDSPELDEWKCREIGFVLAKEYWGQGLMPEAVNEVIRYLFTDVKLDAILCAHYIWNRQSARVQEKCGFRYYKTVISETRIGTTETAVLNILDRDTWLAGHQEVSYD